MGMQAAARRRWRQRLRDDGVVLLPVLAVTLWYFRPLLASADVIYGGLDITRQFYLFKQASVAELQAGRLPLWLPTLYCGMPLLGALIDTPFHPWDLIAALARVPLPVIFNGGLLLHLLIGQVGAYVWVRQDSYRRLPAVLAACWIWNPFILNSILSGDHNNVRAMLVTPAILAALERGLDGRRYRRAWLGYGMLQALQIMCSGLQFAFYTCTLCGLTALATFWHRRGRRPLPEFTGRIRWWLLATLFAAAIPMVQLLPGLRFSSLSVRAGAPVVWSSVWGVPPELLSSYVAPFVDRESNILVYWGLAPLVLAGIGIGAWRRPRRTWCVAVLLVSLVLCIGSDWTVSRWLNELPILRSFRGPFRIAVFANLMIARLAAGGLTATLNYVEEHRHRIRWRLALRRTIAVLAGLIVLALLWWPQSRFFADWSETIPTVVVWGLTASAVGVVVRQPRPLTVAVLLLVAPVDWAVHLRHYWQPATAAAFRPDPIAETLRDEAQEEFFRVWLRATPSANYLALFGIPSVAGHHAFPLLRAAQFVDALDLQDGRLLQLTQTRYVLTYSRRSTGELGPPVRSGGEVEVRRVTGARIPRARVVGAARRFETGEAVWAALRAGDWDPATSPVLLEGKAAAPAETGGRGGVAEFTVDMASHRVVRVHADGPGYLVIADTWYPGWRATVNGAPRPVWRANYLFQAVAVPSGVSTVDLRYQAPGVRIGLFSTVLGLLGWAVAFGRAQSRERALP